MLQMQFFDRFGGTKPIVPGRDFAGTVVQAPSDPQLVGTAVYGTSGRELSLFRDGTHAEYVVVSVEGLAVKPKSLSWIQAGVIGVPYSTAHLMHKSAAAVPGETVLIFGATGAVGKAATAMAQFNDCNVITASRSEGADVNITTDEDLKTVMELNGGKGPDVILDCAGSPTLMKKGLAVLGKGGRYVFVSRMRGVGPEVKVNAMKMLAMDQSLHGVDSWNIALPEVKEFMTKLGDMFEDGKLKAPSEESLNTISIADAAATYQEVAKMGGKEFVIDFKS